MWKKIIFFLLLFNGLIKIGYTQSLVYSYNIQHVQQLSAINSDYTELFQAFTLNDNATISIFYTFQIKIYQKKENVYTVLISYQEDSVVGDVFYRQLTLADLFYPKRVFCNGNIVANEKNVLNLKIQNQAIPLNNTLLDTIISLTENNIIWSHRIEYLQFYLDDSLVENNYLRIKKIDAYYHNDSLFNKWNKTLDKLNLSNVDMLPIYKFTVEDVEKEATNYVYNQFENLLALSNLDNSPYLMKVSKLFNRINNTKKYLTAILPDMDEMLYRKGEEFKQQNDDEKAIYYYQRSLDYNPNCSLSIVALSNYYLHQKNYLKAISLIHNLYQDSNQIIENHTTAHSIYQTLYDLAKEQIERNDYYSALKTLDTLEYYCLFMPPHFCNTHYKLLQQKSKQGIYDSYLDVIRVAINNKKFDLAINYLQGLEKVIKKNGDTLQANEQYNNMLKFLWNSYSYYINKKIVNKQCVFALIDAKEFNNLLDTLAFDYPKQMFSDIYTICYSNLYKEKITEIEKLKQHRNSKNLSKKIKETDDFYLANQQYIQDEKITLLETEEEKERLYYEIQYNRLCSYLNNTEVTELDYHFLDSCNLCRQWYISYQFDCCNEWHNIVEIKCKPIILSIISRINTHIWGNEYKKALPLFEQLTLSMQTLSVTTDSIIWSKYQETQSILAIRACAYMEREKVDQFNKASELCKQKEYDKAEKTLLSIITFPVLCVASSYDDSINNLLKHIEKPAFFQRIYDKALLDISLQKYEEGFRLYNEAYHYFITQAIENYGLECVEEKQFLANAKNIYYYTYVCEKYVQEKEFDKAIEIMLLAVSQKIPFNKYQKTIGKSFLQYVKTNKLNRFQAIKPYQLSQEHIHFLNVFLGKTIAYVYLLLK